MTSKLKCPFCGKKLWYDEQDGIYRCMNFSCVMDYEGGTEQLWQTLTQAKQDLEIVVDALNAITATPLNSRVIHDTANKAIEQIEHKEK